MCFGGGSKGGAQPEAPTNPAPYTTDTSYTAVKQETKDLPKDPEPIVDPATPRASVPSVKNTGANFNDLSI